MKLGSPRRFRIENHIQQFRWNMKHQLTENKLLTSEFIRIEDNVDDASLYYEFRYRKNI